MLVSKTFLSPTPLFQPKSLQNSDTTINMEQFEEDLGALIVPSPPDSPTFFPFLAKIHFIDTFTLFQGFRSQPDNSDLDQASILSKNPDSWCQVLGLNTSRVRTSLLEKSESL